MSVTVALFGLLITVNLYLHDTAIELARIKSQSDGTEVTAIGLMWKISTTRIAAFHGQLAQG